MKAIRVNKLGGPEVLSYEDIPMPEPGPIQVLVRIEACGLNYIDTYYRTGFYKTDVPFTAGQEAAGTVEKVGAEVTDLRVGDRVAHTGILGSYAEYQVVKADRVVKRPDGVDARTAAAVMLQGMTAHYLTHSTYALKSGEWCLVHAAAGGMGLLLCQVAKLLGAKVIGTVSTEEKAKLAREAGADHVILYTKTDFEEEVRRITEKKGVHVVYDGVGKTTFSKSIYCLRPRGMLALYGQASGAVESFDPSILSIRGALFLTRPGLGWYISKREELVERSTAVFDWIRSGKLGIRISRELRLREAADAHRALEGRQTTGKVLLIP
ncbi:MAG: quinone oxidoreductase [Nitrospirae bacterium]|nr:quinone oxidoreductase [Nitrospirota bacterium]